MGRLILFSFLFVSVLSCQSQEDVVMPWSDDYRLKWDDFKGNPNPRGEEVAVTASGLSFGYSTTRYSNGKVNYDFEVTAHFYPEKSWFVEESVNDITLAHERLHFDITELHARKFRQRVQATRFGRNIDFQMDQINNEINEQLRAMQLLYDRETDHSRNIEKQEVWQRYVEDELFKYRDFR